VLTHDALYYKVILSLYIDDRTLQQQQVVVRHQLGLYNKALCDFTHRYGTEHDWLKKCDQQQLLLQYHIDAAST
jgi:hypothetical protein